MQSQTKPAQKTSSNIVNIVGRMVIFLIAVTACLSVIIWSVRYAKSSPTTHTDNIGSPTILAEGLTNIFSIDWMQGDSIALSATIGSNAKRAVDIQIIDPLSGNLTSFRLHLRQLENCREHTLSYFRQLPDGRYGITLRCNYEENWTDYYRLYAFDFESKEAELIHTFPTIKPDKDRTNVYPDDFSLNREQTMMIVESQGDGIFNKLFLSNIENQTDTLIFSEDFRAGSPSWSLATNKIAFAGTDYGGDIREKMKSNPISGGGQLSSALTMPWSLYVMSEDQSEIDVWVKNIRYLDNIRWRPNSDDHLAFRGQVMGRKGLWVYEKSTNNLLFIKAENSESGQRIKYDWSPDGNQIIVVNFQGVYGENVTSTLLLYDLTSTFPIKN